MKTQFLIAGLLSFMCLTAAGASPAPVNSPPKVVITSPKEGTSFRNLADITLLAEAADADGAVRSVEFFSGDKRLGTGTRATERMVPTGPFQYVWRNVPTGRYSLTAKATDLLGLSTTSAPVSITVGASDAKAASLVITSPADGASFTAASTIPVKATAVDPSGYISRVELFANETSVAVSEITFIRAPDPGESIHHNFEWKGVPSGTFALTARAKDSKGSSVSSKPVTIQVKSGTAGAFVIRQLPASYSPGAPLTVQLQATPPSGTKAYAIEDKLPSGWARVAKITHDGVLDEANGKVKFGPFFDATARTLAYEVTPPADSGGEKIFAGSAAADGKVSPVGGASRIDSASLHPADNNPANSEITLNEVTAYSAAWRNGDRWPVSPNPISISYVTRAGALWRGGEFYTYDPKAGSLPGAWVNVTKPQPRAAIGKQSLERSSVIGLARRVDSGQAVTRVIEVRPTGKVLTQAAEDSIPAGVAVSGISDGGVFDSKAGKVKWGPFHDSAARTLSYRAISAPNTMISLAFDGVVSFDGVDVPVATALPLDSAISPGFRSVKAIQRLPNGDVVLTCHGESNQPSLLETSRDLIQWAELATFTAGQNDFQFTHRVDGTTSQRFYRVRRPAPEP